MRKEWEVHVKELESRSDVKELLRNSIFQMIIHNVQRTQALFYTLVENSLNKGKRGIRVFADTTAFLERDLPKNYLNMNHVSSKGLTFLLLEFVHTIPKISIII